MAATKEPPIKTLFTKEIIRYRVDPTAQLDLFNNPKVNPHTFTIAALYVPSIRVVRLNVGGMDNAWRNPIAVEGPDFEYNAVVLALSDLGEIAEMLPYYADRDAAVIDWKAGRRMDWNKGEHGETEG